MRRSYGGIKSKAERPRSDVVAEAGFNIPAVESDGCFYKLGLLVYGVLMIRNHRRPIFWVYM